MSFPDHFSEVAAGYARFRPRYPARVFEFLAELCPQRHRAWDCATGSGQAAGPLAKHFEAVLASDASPAQIRSATRFPGVSYLIARAEAPPFRSRSMDLITVAQAAHWIDLDPFYRSVGEILKERGILAIWAYGILRTSGPLDRIAERYYRETVGDYWPSQRKHIETGYRDLPFPFEEIDPPSNMSLEVSWTLPELLGYIETWSATRRCRKATGLDPMQFVRPELEKAWGSAPKRQFRWPLHFRIGKLDKTRRICP